MFMDTHESTIIVLSRNNLPKFDVRPGLQCYCGQANKVLVFEHIINIASRLELNKKDVANSR